MHRAAVLRMLRRQLQPVRGPTVAQLRLKEKLQDRQLLVLVGVQRQLVLPLLMQLVQEEPLQMRPRLLAGRQLVKL